MDIMELFTGPKRGAVADPRVARLRMYLNNLAVFSLFAQCGLHYH